MNWIRRTAALLALCGVGLSASALGMVNLVVDIDSTPGVCIQRATAAIKGAGLTENFEIIQNTIYGDEGDYTGMIRCIAENKIAVIVVAGPDSDVAGNYADAIDAKFK